MTEKLDNTLVARMAQWKAGDMCRYCTACLWISVLSDINGQPESGINICVDPREAHLL